MRYDTAAAFRRALTDHLSNRSRREGVPVGRLQKQLTFERFPLDVGQGDVTVRDPDRVRGQVDLAFAGLATPTFAVYPLEDHFAEKLHAYTTPRETRVASRISWTCCF